MHYDCYLELRVSFLPFVETWASVIISNVVGEAVNNDEFANTVSHPEHKGQPSPCRTVRFGRYMVPGLLIAGITLLVSITLYLWFELRRHFPDLPAGRYSGFISDHGNDGEAKVLPLLVNALPDEHLLEVIILSPGAQLQTIPWGLASETSLKMPLVINAPPGMESSSTSGAPVQFRLSGQAAENQTFSGTVLNLASGRQGTWKLNPFRASPPQKPGEQELKEHLLWLSLREELSQIESRVEFLENKLPQQREEIAKLTDLVAEGETLRARANQKFGTAREDYFKIAEELKVKQAEAKKLSDSLDVAQRVSNSGRLVSLARESLDREWRWADSMLRTAVWEQSDAFAAAVERGAKIAQLKREIQLERERLATLAGQGAEYE